MARPSAHFQAFSAGPAPNSNYVSAEEPWSGFAADAQSHRLYRQATLAPGEFERTELEAIEVMAFWGSTILFARHLSARETFSIGESSAAELVDFEVSQLAIGMLSAQLIARSGGGAEVVVPSSGRVRVKHAGESQAGPTSLTRVPLLRGTVVELAFEDLSFRIANVPPGTATPRVGLFGLDRSVLSYFGLSLASAAALIAGFAFWVPSLGLNDGEDLDRDRIVLMQQYLSAQAERNLQERLDSAQSGNKDNQPGAPAEAAQGREGAMGKLNAPVTQRRAAVRGDAAEVQLSRAQVLDAARSFGMIELLGTLSSNAQTSSPFVRDPALGHDGMDAEGGMWGDPGESGGVGGLRLSGLDNGGGGHGVGVGLDGVGTCASGSCGPSGTGRDFGRLPGQHKTRAPRIGQGQTVTSGRLPPEVVQRIVRQNYGRFRLCYENGLRSNPNLTGRVTARFVISREGAVSNVQNGGSDLPDAGVVSCVVQAFYGLSFPTPENGIVTVSYPIMLSPG